MKHFRRATDPSVQNIVIQAELRMNRIPVTRTRRRASGRFPRTAARLFALGLLSAAGCSFVTSPTASADDDEDRLEYRLRFTVTPEPAHKGAVVTAVLGQPRYLLREMSMRMPSDRFRDVAGDGELTRDGERVTWLPPEDGGTLSWFVRLEHRRMDDAYDAWIEDDWALFRATDVIPPARTRTLKGAVSNTSLAFALPKGWSSVTQYFGRGDSYDVENPERRYARPTGWILLGDIGTRIERIAGVRVKVTGPTGQSVRRLDMMALMHWTLPHVTRLLPDFPKRLTIFSAAAPMWRGGLSGPRSLFIHADLPLITENATSTLLHEIMHVVAGMEAAEGADWIVEGLAEYYGMELLRRSRTISNDRFRDAVADIREWGKEAESLCDGPSRGAMTARAVAVMTDLDAEIRDGSGGHHGLDDVLRELVAHDGGISVAVLREIAARIHGSRPKALSSRQLPGCD